MLLSLLDSNHSFICYHMQSSESNYTEPIFQISIFVLQVAVTIANEKSVSTVLNSIGRHLLKTDHVTWGKIASLFCVAGGLAIDCVQQGHPEYLYGIIETMGFVIERDAATWIAQQGGWVSSNIKNVLLKNHLD